MSNTGVPHRRIDLIAHSHHAIRGKDHAAAQCWDDIMQRARGETEKSKTVD